LLKEKKIILIETNTYLLILFLIDTEMNTIIQFLFLCLPGILHAQDGNIQPKGCTEESVAKIYADTPYPPRNPNDEKDGIITYKKHEDPNLIRSTIFGGAKLPKKFRAMIAGGGTGDATIALAIGLAKLNHKSTILHVDLSQASLNVAKARIRKHKKTLKNSSVKILFLKASISNLADRDLGGLFHYINCVGVLHHMPNPQHGLSILESFLHPNGGINFMIYGKIGRTGIYHVRKMARILNNDQNDMPTIIESKDVLDSLPSTNFFVNNKMVQESVDVQDFLSEASNHVGINDMIRNPCDIAMTIDEVNQFALNSNMRILAPVFPKDYEPKGNQNLLSKLNSLEWIKRAAFSELQSGTIAYHHVWLVKNKNNVIPTEKIPWNKQSIPCRADWMPGDFMPFEDANQGLLDESIRYETSIGGDETVEQINDKGLPALGPTIIFHMNCYATLNEIFTFVKEEASWDVDWDTFLEHANEWRASMSKARAVHTLLEKFDV
jgi:2-polyprenyl-3-methyl-5-hydroxy-6-metoxy-1,4-benzoquinol methylase